MKSIYVKKPPLATIINFCSNEVRFIHACIEQCRLFSSQIIIPVCDHFFNGIPEHHELLEQIFNTFPDCLFIYYPFMPERIPKQVLRRIGPSHFWHSTARALGSCFLEKEIESVLFLDADELPEGQKFLQWLNTSNHTQYNAIKLANYWYFREPSFQSISWEDSVALAKRSILNPSLLLHEREREIIYDQMSAPKKRRVTGDDGKPMFHHFSWVRTKEEMLRKVTTWGHRHDRNWKELVEEEFNRPFNGTDFISGYSYRECSPLFEISLKEHPHFIDHAGAHCNVRRISPKELLRLLGLDWRKIFTWRLLKNKIKP